MHPSICRAKSKPKHYSEDNYYLVLDSTRLPVFIRTAALEVVRYENDGKSSVYPTVCRISYRTVQPGPAIETHPIAPVTAYRVRIASLSWWSWLDGGEKFSKLANATTTAMSLKGAFVLFRDTCAMHVYDEQSLTRPSPRQILPTTRRQ
jgi:hypothetical protein